MVNKVVEVLCFAFGISGALLISMQKGIGFWLMLVCNILGVVLFYRSNLKWMSFSQVLFALTALNGIFKFL